MNYFVSLQEILREVSYLSQFMRHYLILFATLLLMTASCGGRKSGDAQDTVPDDCQQPDQRGCRANDDRHGPDLKRDIEDTPGLRCVVPAP